MRNKTILNVVVLSIVMNGTRGDYDATCGEHGICVPTFQCLKPHAGQCTNVWCCKQATYTMSPPPEEECICVSNKEICGEVVNPYLHVHLEASCQCCDCINQCVPLLTNGLCPSYEKDRGVCDVEKHFCCEEDTGNECKCFEECPESWKVVGTCKKCCLPCKTGKNNVTNNPTCEATNTGQRAGLYPVVQVLLGTMVIMTLST